MYPKNVETVLKQLNLYGIAHYTVSPENGRIWVILEEDLSDKEVIEVLNSDEFSSFFVEFYCFYKNKWVLVINPE